LQIVPALVFRFPFFFYQSKSLSRPERRTDLVAISGALNVRLSGGTFVPRTQRCPDYANITGKPAKSPHLKDPLATMTRDIAHRRWNDGVVIAIDPARGGMNRPRPGAA
jgi:hypothetical protein